jgi:FkbM family methyltransferase
MRIRLGDWLGRHVYVTGEYEPATGAVIAELLKPGQTFVDVGANAGYFALLASRTVGESGRVYAFEPIPSVRDDLMVNAELNGMTNIEIRGEALADRAGQAQFFVGPEDHKGTSSLRALPVASQTVTVQTARLDDLVSTGRRVDMVKIDVEGAEYLALLGMEACLRRHRPDLVVEVTDSYLRVLGHSAGELCAYLATFGYQMYAIEHGGLRLVNGDMSGLPQQFNALFTCRKTLPRAILAPNANPVPHQ